MAFQTGWTKLLSLWHLHAQYAGLMVAPVHMCADWSYRCVPLVQRFSDPRNLQSLALYAWVLWALLEGRPWEVVAEMLGYSKVRHDDPEPSSKFRNLQSLALYAWVLWHCLGAGPGKWLRRCWGTRRCASKLQNRPHVCTARHCSLQGAASVPGCWHSWCKNHVCFLGSELMSIFHGCKL